MRRRQRWCGTNSNICSVDIGVIWYISTIHSFWQREGHPFQVKAITAWNEPCWQHLDRANFLPFIILIILRSRGKNMSEGGVHSRRYGGKTQKSLDKSFGVLSLNVRYIVIWEGRSRQKTPCVVRNTFDSFRSLWASPQSCTYARVCRISCPNFSACSSVNRWPTWVKSTG